VVLVALIGNAAEHYSAITMARRDQMDATLAIAVISVAFIAHDGETNWMEGVQLLAVYAILVLGFYFLPAGIS
jgi:Ca2+:H+ antiporter